MNTFFGVVFLTSSGVLRERDLSVRPVGDVKEERPVVLRHESWRRVGIRTVKQFTSSLSWHDWNQ